MGKALVAWLALVVFGSLAAQAEPLVDNGWLKARLGTPELVILDIRSVEDKGKKNPYLAGHVPGAIHADYNRALWRTLVGGVPQMLPAVAQLEALIGELGISNDSQVVIVGSGDSAAEFGSATRVYWTFKVVGHDAVSILDGGWKAWAADPGNPVETKVNQPDPVIFTVDLRTEMLATKDDVKAALADGKPLIDNRPPAQFRGQEMSPALRRPGTVPGARNVPEELLVDGSGHFADTARLAELWHDAGVDPQAEQITFCNTGHWGSLGWFALHELLGNTRARLYDGSMAEWSRDPDLPMVTEGRPAAANARPAN